MSQQSSDTDISVFEHDNINRHYHEESHHHCDAEDWETGSNDLILSSVSSSSSSKPVAAVLESSPSSSEEDSVELRQPLTATWNYYYHLPNDKSWVLDSYKTVMSDIGSLEQLIGINEVVTDNIIKNCMLFVMRRGITPMWEDAQNRQGGCFSYKVTNKTVVGVWRRLIYLLCGYTLTVDPTHMDWVNGITISPKRGFCIIKIWMRNCTLQDPAVIVNIEHLMRNGCLFKAHSPEF